MYGNMEMKEKKEVAGIGRCIYCGRLDYADNVSNPKLRKEHVFPSGLGGKLIILEASCQKCERITGRFESKLLNNDFAGLRNAVQFPRRTKPKDRSKRLPIFEHRDGSEKKMFLPLAHCPSAIVFPVLPDPPLLSEIGDLGESHFDHRPICDIRNYKPDLLKRRYGLEKWSAQGMDTRLFCRLLAKIAYGLTVTGNWFEDFEPIFLDKLLDPNLEARGIMPFIGGCEPEEPRDDLIFDYGFLTTDVAGKKWLMVKLRLFPSLNLPTYRILVGVEKGFDVSSFPDCTERIKEMRNFYRIQFSGSA